MVNRYDFGIREDFNKMTKELATEITVAPRAPELTSEGQENENSQQATAVTEYASIVELDTKHEMIASGQMDVGDVVITWESASTVVPESIVKWDGNTYKMLSVKSPKGLQNNITSYIVGYGKKIPNR